MSKILYRETRFHIYADNNVFCFLWLCNSVTLDYNIFFSNNILSTFYIAFLEPTRDNSQKKILSKNFFVLRFYAQIYSPNSDFIWFFVIVGISYQNCGNGSVGIN